MSFRPLLIIAVVSLVACGGDEDSGPERVRSDVFSYALAMPAGQTLYLRDMSGSITVEPAEDDTLRVVADLHWRGDETPPSDVTFNRTATANGVLVCVIIGGAECSTEKYESNSDGSGFSIRRRGLRLGLGGGSQAEVHFRVKVPTGVKLDLLMIDGDVVSASSAPVRARGVNGDITVVTSVGPVTARTVNGDADARISTLTGSDSVHVETVNGSAFLFLPGTVSATVEMASVNGTLLTDFPGVPERERIAKQLMVTLGSGSAPVRVRTINGNAQLRRLDAQGRAYEISSP